MNKEVFTNADYSVPLFNNDGTFNRYLVTGERVFLTGMAKDAMTTEMDLVDGRLQEVYTEIRLLSAIISGEVIWVDELDFS